MRRMFARHGRNRESRKNEREKAKKQQASGDNAKKGDDANDADDESSMPNALAAGENVVARSLSAPYLALEHPAEEALDDKA